MCNDRGGRGSARWEEVSGESERKAEVRERGSKRVGEKVKVKSESKTERGGLEECISGQLFCMGSLGRVCALGTHSTQGTERQADGRQKCALVFMFFRGRVSQFALLCLGARVRDCGRKERPAGGSPTPCRLESAFCSCLLSGRPFCLENHSIRAECWRDSCKEAARRRTRANRLAIDRER